MRQLSSFLALFLFHFLFQTTSFAQTATQVVITTQPVIGGGNGGLMTIQPVVEIRDASNQRVTNSTAPVTIEIATGTGGTLGGTTTISAVNGVATFTNLTFLGTVGQNYTFRFRSEPVVAYEPFNYTNGVSVSGQNGGSGWSGAWGNANGAFTDLVVNSTGFTYTGFTTVGGRSSYTSGTGGDAARNLAASSNAQSVVWLSFLGNYTQQGGGFNNVRFAVQGSPGFTGAIGGNDNYANWSILSNNLTSSTFSSAALNGTTRLALARIDYVNNTTALWMDPVVATFDGTQTPSHSVNFAPIFNRIELYNRTTGVGTDEITLAQTFKAALHLENNLTPAVSAGSTALPVALSSFSVQCKTGISFGEDAGFVLSWTTSSESNNSHFLVQRATNNEWQTIGRVEGKGNSSTLQSYQFVDNIPGNASGNASGNSPKRRYRLQQVGFDGAFQYSNVVAADCPTSTSVTDLRAIIRVGPNPAAHQIIVSGTQTQAQWRLIDQQGKLIRNGFCTKDQTTIGLNGVATGQYFLQILQQDQSITMPILKQ
jgi:hypothetical protein